jgi:phosphoglycerol transferase MdoB-like AlkP superfamily enzyme
MDRIYAVLKIAFAVLCMSTIVSIPISIAQYLLAGMFSALQGAVERTSGILLLLLFLLLAFLLTRFCYRLYQRVIESGVLARKIPLSMLKPEKETAAPQTQKI